MRNADLTPLFRNSVGFDRFDDLLNAALSGTPEAVPAFPPYDIERVGENDYRITMAVAGYSEDDLSLVQEDTVLTVKGTGTKPNADDKQNHFLHRGIARRAFERRFHLDDTIRVTGADLSNGLLVIELVREVPEHQRPRQIQIGNGPALEAAA
ncbi:MAG: Hsp20 family protein [Alphaproteobacteria bacterium]